MSVAIWLSLSCSGIAIPAHASQPADNPTGERKPVRIISFAVPLQVGNQVLGDVLIETDGSSAVRIDSNTLQNELRPLLNDAGQAQLEQVILGRGDKELLDEILLFGLHAGFAFAATTL